VSEQNRVALATMGSLMEFRYLSQDKLTFCLSAEKIVSYCERDKENPTCGFPSCFFTEKAIHPFGRFGRLGIPLSAESGDAVCHFLKKVAQKLSFCADRLFVRNLFMLTG